MLKRLCLLGVLAVAVVPALADSDDNLESICKAINCSEAAGLPMSWDVHRLGKSSLYRLQATIFDGVDTDRLNTVFKSAYPPSDSSYALETLMQGREIAWQDWLDAEGAQTRFYEVGDRILRKPGAAHARVEIEPALEPTLTTSDPPSMANVPESGTLGLMALGLFAISWVVRKRKGTVMFR